jgi:uncharacterized membrane protein YecN with MAPEG domain
MYAVRVYLRCPVSLAVLFLAAVVAVSVGTTSLSGVVLAVAARVLHFKTLTRTSIDTA